MARTRKQQAMSGPTRVSRPTTHHAESLPHDLVSLPLDAKTHILSFIRKRSDLKALYAMCKELYEVVIARVYRCIALKATMPIQVLSAFLSPDNRGLPHIRHVRIMAASTHANGDCLNTMYMLANQLPRNILLTMVVDEIVVVGHAIAETLHRRQRQLRTLRVDSTLSGTNWSKGTVFNMEVISSLQFLIVNNKMLKTARKCLELTPAVQHVEIHVNMADYCASRKLKLGDELHRATASENIMSALMGQDDDVDLDNHCEVRQRRLSTLRLYGLNLSGVAVHLLQATDVTYLSSLSIQRCEHEVALLRMLAAAEEARCVRLRHLAVIQSPETELKLNRDSALDDFLKSFDALESLVISAPKTAALRPELGTVAQHARRLRSIYLDCRHTTPDLKYRQSYEAEDIEAELADCKELQQLALSFPQPLLDTYLDDDDDLSEFLDSLKLLPSMSTLQMLNLPSPDGLAYTPRDDEGGETYVTTSLTALAKRVFCELPGVTTFALGRCSIGGSVLGRAHTYRRCFGRGRLIDMDGQESVAAIELEKSAARELEPVSDLLDVEPEEKRVMRYGQKD